jgi:hypothetical protein
VAQAQLVTFVESALRAGQSRDAVRGALEQAGWAKEQVADALAHYADVAFAVPVPRPRVQLSARDAFWYLLMFGTLYISAYNLGDLLFGFINKMLPDDLDGYRPEFVDSGIRWATASLIVAFPVFLLCALKLAKEVAADPSRRNSAVRKWLTYLTLLIAACVLVGDVIVLVNSLLSGELTLRFVLKVIVAGAIAGAGFGYFMWSLRLDDQALER